MAEPVRIERRVAEEVVDELLGERLRELLATEQSTRDAQDEIATLRQELATSEDACASAMAEVEALKADVRRLDAHIEHLTHEVAFWKEQRDLAANVAAGIADMDEVAPALRQVLRTERERRKRSEEESDRRAYAAQRVLDLYDSGNVLGTIAAIPGLRDALDGGT